MSSSSNSAKRGLALILAGAGLVVLFSSMYTIKETEQAIITQFGKPVGDPVVDAGLKFKIPFVQKINLLEKRILARDGTPNEMPTMDKTYIIVDTFGRWRISEPKVFFERLRDERSALSRLSDILGSETQSVIASHELIEVVRTTKDRTPAQSIDIIESDRSGKIGVLRPIRKGRSSLEQEIFREASPKLKEFGIELLDIRFKRINYNPSVQNQIFQRMISERQQIAERFRSEGAGEAAKIMGKMERDLREIESGAYRTVEEVRGEADAKATAIYAASYNQSAEAAELYAFTRTLKVYEDVIDRDTTLILSTDSELFHLLKTMEPTQP
ncbi:MAG: protease modulator HflC [Verrucomicrobiales bacterium]